VDGGWEVRTPNARSRAPTLSSRRPRPSVPRNSLAISSFADDDTQLSASPRTYDRRAADGRSPFRLNTEEAATTTGALRAACSFRHCLNSACAGGRAQAAMRCSAAPVNVVLAPRRAACRAGPRRAPALRAGRAVASVRPCARECRRRKARRARVGALIWRPTLTRRCTARAPQVAPSDDAPDAAPAQLARRDALALAAAAVAAVAAAGASPADAAGVELGLRRIGRSAKFDKISPDAYKTLPSGLKYYDVVVRARAATPKRERRRALRCTRAPRRSGGPRPAGAPAAALLRQQCNASTSPTFAGWRRQGCQGWRPRGAALRLQAAQRACSAQRAVALPG